MADTQEKFMQDAGGAAAAAGADLRYAQANNTSLMGRGQKSSLEQLRAANPGASDVELAEALVLAVGQQAPAPTPETPSTSGPLSGLPGWAKFAGSVGLSGVGGALGAAGGTAVAPGVGTAVGLGLGSAGGTALSQQLGLEEKSTAGIVTSGALGALAPGAGKLLGQLPKLLPGAAVARVNQLALEAPGFIAKFAGEQAGALWGLLRGSIKGLSFESIPVTKTAIKELGEETALAVRGVPGVAKIRSLLSGLDDAVSKGKLNDLPALDANIKLIGKAIGKMEREGGSELGAFKKVLASLYDDLEHAPLLSGNTAEVVALRKAAVQASKKEFALDELKETVFSGTRVLAGSTDAMTIDAAKILNRIESLVNPSSKSYDKNFVTGLGKELPEIKKWFTVVNSIARQAGKGGTLILQGMFAGAGAALAGTPGAVAGAMVGAQVPDMLFSSLVSPAGRKILLQAVQAGEKLGRSTITPQVLNLTSQLGRSFIAQGGVSE